MLAALTFRCVPLLLLLSDVRLWSLRGLPRMRLLDAHSLLLLRPLCLGLLCALLCGLLAAFLRLLVGCGALLLLRGSRALALLILSRLTRRAYALALCVLLGARGRTPGLKRRGDMAVLPS